MDCGEQDMGIQMLQSAEKPHHIPIQSKILVNGKNQCRHGGRTRFKCRHDGEHLSIITNDRDNKAMQC
jgi:hypothetical protein